MISLKIIKKSVLIRLIRVHPRPIVLNVSGKYRAYLRKSVPKYENNFIRFTF